MSKIKHWYQQGYHFLENTNIMAWLIQTTRTQALRADACILWVVLAVLAGTILADLGNRLFFHYNINVFSSHSIGILMGPLVLWVTGILLEKRFPRTGTLAVSIAFASLYWAVMVVGCAALLATPFTDNLLDPILLIADEWMHFPQELFITLANQKQWIPNALAFAYDSWSIQIVAVVILIGSIGLRRMTRLWMLSALISFLVGGLIYYFFPSLPPAAHLVSPFFKITSYNLIDRFYQIHHHFHYVLRGADGLIAFPSFHIIQSTANSIFLWWSLAYTSKRWWWPLLIINIALTILNIMLFFSTLGLGFHFLIDIIGGILIALFSLWACLGLSAENNHTAVNASES